MTNVPKKENTYLKTLKINPILLAFAITLTLTETDASQQNLPWQKENLKWTQLAGCRLDTTKTQDGDSFTLLYQNQRLSVRLYWVDAPETSKENRNQERIEDQAKTFGISKKDSQTLGDIAAEFTKNHLTTRPFTIYTLGKNALGRGKFPRVYAFVQTGQGDLGELLIKNGLARIKGYKETPPNWRGTEKDYHAHLEKLLRNAQTQKKGIWKWKK
jgi:endonuclease YncB( thermonuclease family)